jgi:uncharacterized protein YeaO (DUF488 family)
MLRLKRAYEPKASSDGRRILVDRLWPRGLSKKTDPAANVPFQGAQAPSVVAIRS